MQKFQKTATYILSPQTLVPCTPMRHGLQSYRLWTGTANERIVRSTITDSPPDIPLHSGQIFSHAVIICMITIDHQHRELTDQIQALT